MNRVTRQRRKNSHVDLQLIKQYLQFGTYPKGISRVDKRTARKRAERFLLDNDVLFYIAKPKQLDEELPDPNPEENKDNYRKVILTVREQVVLTTKTHVTDKGMHMGKDRTLNALTSKYYWVGMSLTVHKVIKNCAVCTANQSGHSNKLWTSQAAQQTPGDFFSNGAIECFESGQSEISSTLIPMSLDASSEPHITEQGDFDLEYDDNIVSQDEDNFMANVESLKAQRFWEKVEIQIISGSEGKQTKEKEDGRRKKKPCIIIAMDSFSKWPEAKRLDKVNEETVSQFIFQLIARFGVMGHLVLLEKDTTDQQLINLSILTENFSCFHTLVSRENPNPYDDLWLRVYKTMSNFMDRYPESWSPCLELCLMPLRNSVSSKMDYTPAFIATGRDPVFPSFLFPDKDSVDSEMMLNQEQMEHAVDSIMTKYQHCCQTDIKPVASLDNSGTRSVNSLPVYEKKIYGTRKSGRKLTVSHRLADYEITPREEYTTVVNEQKDERQHTEGDRPKEMRNQQLITRNYKKSLNSGDSLSKMSLDVYYKIIREHIEKGTYPPGSSEDFKRTVRSAKKGYMIDEGQLMYKHKGKNKMVPMTLKERLQILHNTHTITAGHHPKSKQIDELDRRKIHWKNMVIDVTAYIKACPDCKHGQPRPRLKTFLREEAPCQGEDTTDLICYLQKGAEPKHMSRTELVVFKKRAKNFQLEKGLLYYNMPADRGKRRRVLLTHEEKHGAMKEAHGESHASADHMMTELQQKYHWHSMWSDVEHFLTACCMPDMETGEKKDDELKQTVDLFTQYFHGEDICGQEVCLDSLFTKPENEGCQTQVTTSEQAPAMALESLDDQTGELIVKVELQCKDEMTAPEVSVIQITSIADAIVEAQTLPSLLTKAFPSSVNASLNEGEIEQREGEENSCEKVVQSHYRLQTAGENVKDMSCNPVPRKKGAKMRCEICKAIITGENSYKEHMYKHTGVKPFTCQVCNKKYTSIKGMRLHMRKHTGHRPYLCNICGRGFPRSATLRYHLKSHEKGGIVPAKCDLCNRLFTSEHRLKKHKRFKHPAQKPVFICDTCGKHFTAKRSLKRHEEAHQGIRKYVCPVCNRSFFRKEYLTYHLNSHYKDNPDMAHLASTKRKLRHRVTQQQLPGKEGEECGSILSIVTVGHEEVGHEQVGPEEVYAHIVEGEAADGHTAMPSIYSLDGGTLQVSEVGTDSTILMVQDHSGAGAESGDPGMQIHHLILPDPQAHPNQHPCELQLEDKDTKPLLHPPATAIVDIQDQHHHVEMTLSNGQRFRLSRTGGTEGIMNNGEQETVQYQVECLSGQNLTEADLQAIRLLAQATVLPQ